MYPNFPDYFQRFFIRNIDIEMLNLVLAIKFFISKSSSKKCIAAQGVDYVESFSAPFNPLRTA